MYNIKMERQNYEGNHESLTQNYKMDILKNVTKI